ncbi:hypothetical protein [Neisseria wadsworthii]|nr:hypothetical protein [Neisseria wadsworthii]
MYPKNLSPNAAGKDARPTIRRVDSDGLDACLKTLPSINLPAAYR